MHKKAIAPARRNVVECAQNTWKIAWLLSSVPVVCAFRTRRETRDRKGGWKHGEVILSIWRDGVQ